MINQVLQAAVTMFLPYFTPVIFIIGAAAVADRLRDMVVTSFLGSSVNDRRSNY